MAIIKLGGSDPYKGQVLTSMGYREQRPMLCYVCGERKPGSFTVNGNGQPTCSDCSPKDAAALKGVCDADCACTEPCDDGPESA